MEQFDENEQYDDIEYLENQLRQTIILGSTRLGFLKQEIRPRFCGPKCSETSKTIFRSLIFVSCFVLIVELNLVLGEVGRHDW